MRIEDLQHHMDARFDRLEDKVDDFQEKITENRSDIGWIKGHLKVTVTIILAAAGFMATALYESLRGTSW